ncbi:hypothetical protein OG943_19790 [Amycolatopsis sp. NBC_00345]
MNEILALQNIPVEPDPDSLGLLQFSTASVNCTSGRTIFRTGDN